MNYQLENINTTIAKMVECMARDPKRAERLAGDVKRMVGELADAKLRQAGEPYRVIEADFEKGTVTLQMEGRFSVEAMSDDIKLPPLPPCPIWVPDGKEPELAKLLRFVQREAIAHDRQQRGTVEGERAAFERSVIERMKEGGFLEIEIRTECLVRSEDDYQDELINYGWWAWQARAALAATKGESNG